MRFSYGMANTIRLRLCTLDYKMMLSMLDSTSSSHSTIHDML